MMELSELRPHHLSGKTIMRQILENSAQRAIAYLESLEDRRVAPNPASIQLLTNLMECFQEEPTDPAQVLHMLDKFGSPATMAMAGPRFFGFVIALAASGAGHWLAGAGKDALFR
jgi:hypothetical protein